MVNQLTAKNCEKISHIEVPTGFLYQGGKRQNIFTKEGGKTGPQSKKGKKDQGVQLVGDANKSCFMHSCSTKLKWVCRNLLFMHVIPLYFAHMIIADVPRKPSLKHGRERLPTVLGNSRVILGKYLAFNYRNVVKKHVACIKDKLKRFISEPLVITGEKKIATSQ